MNFVIDETYRITSDRNQWIIQRARKRKRKVVWEGFKFFTTFDQCVQRLGEMLCRELDTEGVSEALAGIDTVSAKLTAALSPCFEVVAVFEEENTPCKELWEKVSSPAPPKPHHANTGSSGGEA